MISRLSGLLRPIVMSFSASRATLWNCPPFSRPWWANISTRTDSSGATPSTSTRAPPSSRNDRGASSTPTATDTARRISGSALRCSCESLWWAISQTVPAQAQAPPRWADGHDVCAVGRFVVEDHLSIRDAAELHIGPTFAQSGRFGGADADLIYDGTLLDLKSTGAARVHGSRRSAASCGRTRSSTTSGSFESTCCRSSRTTGCRRSLWPRLTATARPRSPKRERLKQRWGRPSSAPTRLAADEQTPLPDGLTLHALRRTCASVLVALGKDPRYVMAQLGHTDPTVTLDIYAHAMTSSDDDRERLRLLVEGADLAVDGSGSDIRGATSTARASTAGAESA